MQGQGGRKSTEQDVGWISHRHSQQMRSQIVAVMRQGYIRSWIKVVESHTVAGVAYLRLAVRECEIEDV